MAGNDDVRFRSSIDDKILKQFQRINKEIKASDRNLARVNGQVKKIDRSLKRTQGRRIGGRGGVGGGFGSAGLRGGAGGAFGGSFLSTFGLGGGGGAIAGLAVAGGLIAATTQFASFERKMSEVKGLTRATTLEFFALEQQAKTLGRTTEFSATQSAEGQIFLAKAGLKTNQILKALPGTQNLAIIGNLELGRSADIATNLMSGMGKEAEDLDGIIDVISNTITSSNTDVEEMGQAFKFLAPVLNQIGDGFEDGAAAVGKFANNGLKGGIATRALATQLTKIVGDKKVIGFLRNLGIEIFDNKGDFIGLINLVGELERVTKGMSLEQRTNIIRTVAGGEAYKNFAILVKEGKEELVRYRKELSKVGTTQVLVDQKTDNLVGSWKEFVSALSGAGIAIGDTTDNIFRDILDSTTEFINEFTDRLEFTKLKEILDDLKKQGQTAAAVAIVQEQIQKASPKILAEALAPVQRPPASVFGGASLFMTPTPRPRSADAERVRELMEILSRSGGAGMGPPTSGFNIEKLEVVINSPVTGAEGQIVSDSIRSEIEKINLDF